MQPGDRGIDVANFQHPHGAPIDYATVRAAGYSFAYIELTDGTSFQNQFAPADAKGFRSAGIKVGPYVFYRPDDAFDEQVSDFLKMWRACGPWDLPIMIDLEVEAADGWVATAQYVGEFRSNLITATNGDEVGVYLNQNFYDNLPGCPWGWDIWLADPSHPDAPSKPCLLQQTGTGTVPGISGTVDLDVWRKAWSPTPFPQPPVPKPAPQEEDMAVTDLVKFNGQDHQAQRNASGLLWHFWRAPGGAFVSEGLPHPGNFVGNPILYVDDSDGALVVECEEAAATESLMVNRQLPGAPWSGWAVKP